MSNQKSWLRVLLGVPAAERPLAIMEDPSLLDAALEEADALRQSLAAAQAQAATDLRAMDKIAAERDVLKAERDRLTGPEMRERIRCRLLGAGMGNLWADAAADAVMSLLRGEGGR